MSSSSIMSSFFAISRQVFECHLTVFYSSANAVEELVEGVSVVVSFRKSWGFCVVGAHSHFISGLR
jgi:hypothetical protein